MTRHLMKNITSQFQNLHISCSHESSKIFLKTVVYENVSDRLECKMCEKDAY